MRCRWCRCEGQAWGMRGAVPPAAWAFAILVASDMLFLRRFPGRFAPFAFSHSGGAEQAPEDPRSPESAHTATPRVNKYGRPSLAASDSLRTYLLPQASRCKERGAG